MSMDPYRDECGKCGEQYATDNLYRCDRCARVFCYRCVWRQPHKVDANGNLFLCRCGNPHALGTADRLNPAFGKPGPLVEDPVPGRAAVELHAELATTRSVAPVPSTAGPSTPSAPAPPTPAPRALDADATRQGGLVTLLMVVLVMWGLRWAFAS